MEKIVISESAKAKACDFIDNEKQFQLGFLPTEQSNPITATIEEDFKRSTLAGVQCLQRGDRQIPITMRHVFASEKFEKLVSSMVETLKAPKGRIIFSGCGATGRLSILLESMWRDFFHRRAAELTPQERKLADRSASIMTGGDFALIKSVESFEDSMAGGERQAAALNIGEGDTFVAITEGGETSSVLGTLRYASRHGAKCFLVFNNPAYLLRDRLDRCREAIDNPKVTVIDLYCGSMSVAGSTRMQATSSEQLLGSCALEAALCRVMPRFAKETARDYTVAFERLLNSLESPSSRENIAGAIDFEYALYAKNGRVTYFADDCMLDLFTDTTERSPTFMLPPFRSTDEGALAQSWAFVKNPLHRTEACWNALFHRDVRCLEWNHGDYQAPGMPKLKNGELPKIGRRYLMKYPIGNEDTAARYAGCESAAVIVRAGKADSAFEAAARAQAAKFGTIRLFTVAPAAPSPLEVWKHLAVKLTFNNLSTGTMVKMGRVSGNWMSWVSISNKKLIDRGIRLISELGRIPYAEAAERLFDAEERIESQDWTGRETPCAVQVALKWLRDGKPSQGDAANQGEHTMKTTRQKVACCASALLFSAITFASGAAASAPEVLPITVQVGDVRVGFTIGMGKWMSAKNAKTSGGQGSDKAFVAASIIPHGQMKSLSVTTNGNVVTAVWKGHPVCGENFTATAKMTLRPDGGFEYTSFDYSGNESGLYVQRIAFPEVVVPRTAKTALFRPRKAGDVFRPDWSKVKPGRTVYASGLLFKVFNCMAALEEGGVSHFLDQRGDARLHGAMFEAAAGTVPGTLVLRNVYLSPVSEGTRKAGAMPYGGVYAPYRGGWYEAALMHRRWMETTPWFKAAAARDFSKLRDIDLWMWSRGNIAVSEPPVHWFMKETGLKVALDWYWWHNVPYDTSYPFFWPPRDGEEAFRAAVKRMRDAGAFVQVYTNGMLWDECDPRWSEGGLESAIVRDTGRIYGIAFNPFTKKSQAHMCGEAPKFQAKMRALEKTLASTGLDGVYMDMISCAAHQPCFNPRHAHAPGDVHALIDGYRRYVDAVHADNPGFLLSSEATSETYLDRFESFIMLYSSWERNGLGTLPEVEPVPAVTVIYRGAGVIFGSFATPGGVPAWDPLWGKHPGGPEEEKIVAAYPDQFAVEFARGVVWGVQPMVHNFLMRDVANPRIAKDIQFMKDSARFYHDHRDFLFDGTMLAPASLECATKRVAFLSAGCYKRPKDGKPHVQKALPTVFHSEWRAPDGRKAAVLVNWTREEQKYELDFDGVRKSDVLPPLSWKAERL